MFPLQFWPKTFFLEAQSEYLVTRNKFVCYFAAKVAKSKSGQKINFLKIVKKRATARRFQDIQGFRLA